MNWNEKNNKANWLLHLMRKGCINSHYSFGKIFFSEIGNHDKEQKETHDDLVSILKNIQPSIKHTKIKT